MNMQLRKKTDKNVLTVLGVLNDEIHGDARSAMNKLTKDYTMTWIYRHPKNGKLFPRTKKDIKAGLKKVYPTKGRHYDIKNIATGNNVVIVELVESYPDPKTKKVYRTPLVLVLEMKKGKIQTGRHYCDPNLSYLHLTKKQVANAYVKTRKV